MWTATTTTRSSPPSKPQPPAKGKPTVLIAKTTKGKGVSFMENDPGWHGKAPNDEQYAQAKAEVEAKLAELEGK